MRIQNCLAWMFFVVVSVSLIAGPGIAQTAVPMLISYQGMLRDPLTGDPVPDGEYDMVFHIFDIEFGGTYLWKGSHDSINGNPIPVQDGLFTVLLGSGTGPPLSASLFNGPDRWLEIVLEGETLEPRQRLASVPYSFVSENSRLLDGQEASNFASASHLHSGDDIVDGIVSEKWIDAAITRDSELSAHASDSAAHHKKTTTFAELTDIAADAQIPAGIARDAEVMPAVLAGDGSGSTLDADLLDGKDIAAFALSGHTHSALYWSLMGNSGTDPATHFLGTSDNQAVELRVDNARALRLEPGESPNIVGGYAGNSVMAGVLGATIAGGGRADYTNSVTDNYGTIGGGRHNQAGDNAGTTIDRLSATVGGGSGNTASGQGATVSGGGNNTASAIVSTVGGGERNTANRDSATVGGGQANTAAANYATVSGGNKNTAEGDWATVGGGYWNTARGLNATVSGGSSNDAIARSATVGGGLNNTASGEAVAVGGGWFNTASNTFATVGGGWSNTASGEAATVGGGVYNEASSSYATIAGGGPSDPANPSGTRNVVTGEYGTMGGGGGNRANASYATVGGGYSNDIKGTCATVGGGGVNVSSGDWATVSGGNWNTASGSYAVVPGGRDNTAGGNYSFAAGYRAKANHPGSFVLADSTNEDFVSVRDDALRVRFAGGATFVVNDGYWVRFWKTDTRVIEASNGAHLTTGGAWTNGSDRNTKENFTLVDAREVLSQLARLPVSRWNYKAEDPSIRHMGPMAQDLYAAFGLGDSDKSITTIDADGIAFAAIQGLHEMLREKDDRISTLEARIAALESVIKKLVECQTGGAE